MAVAISSYGRHTVLYSVLYVFMVNLTTQNIQHQVTGWIVNDESDRIRNKLFTAKFKVPFHLHGGSEWNHEKPSQRSWSGHLNRGLDKMQRAPTDTTQQFAVYTTTHYTHTQAVTCGCGYTLTTTNTNTKSDTSNTMFHAPKMACLPTFAVTAIKNLPAANSWQPNDTDIHCNAHSRNE